MARNLLNFIATCDECDSADNHGGGGDFEVQQKISVIRPKSFRYKITDTLPLTPLQSLANGDMTSIMPVAIALSRPGIVCDADLASGQFASEGETCLSCEVFWGSGQLNEFAVALGLVILREVWNLHRSEC
ncbi:MAG: hypothetical protein WB762_15205 [Candidatus Sulfotelmatobacter sp.]